ncbi:unnamed protein product, partial [marine sediment metagenome]
DIQEKFQEVKEDPSKLEALFTLPPKEIYGMPDEVHQMSNPPSRNRPSAGSSQASTTIENSQATQNAIDQHIQSIQHEVTGERAKKVDAIMQLIKDQVKENMKENYERVFRQIHPSDLEGNMLHEHLNNYEEKYLKIIAGFDKNFLEHFLIISVI